MFEIAQNAKGRLWIMPCPDGAQLDAEVVKYRAAGADQIISMLAQDEAAELGLASEGAACARAGLGFAQHSIQDFGLPDPNRFAGLIRQINTALADAQNVAVHCRAGIGRSGMVTACVLVAQGLDAPTAMARVTHARGVSIPDTVEQGSFIAEFARTF